MSITKYGASTDQISKTASERPADKPVDPRKAPTLPLPAISQEEAERIRKEKK